MKKVITTCGILLLMCCSIACTVLCFYFAIQKKEHPSLTFIGHASVKLKSTEGKVIYIDPYYPVGDYRDPADYILITHGHDDHNKIALCKQAEDCQIIRWTEGLKNGEYQTFEKDGVRIEVVPSGGNSYHSDKICVGYIVTIDGVSVYHAGDTSMNEGKYTIAEKKIDYAMYPVDGYFDMGPEEATEVADLIGATYNVPIHGFDKEYKRQFQEFHAEGKILMKVGETILLNTSN